MDFSVLAKPISGLFYGLSRFVYLLAKIAYDLFNSLASFTLVNPGDAQTILTRVEMIVVIIMFFVIAFNLLNYIIDPDKAKDKKSGTSTLIKDIVLALVILVMINPVFVTLYSLQDTVIKSGIIFNVFNIGAGGSIDKDNNDIYVELDKNKQCVYDKSEKSISECEMVYSVNKMIAIVYASFIERTDGADSDYLECGGKDDAYCTAYNNVLMTGKIDSLHELTKTADYAYMACAIPSFIAGLVLAFFLFSFCFNLAIRAAKLGMLQIIAPVPVVMAILPGKSDLRNTWIKEVSKTFVEIFFYLIIIAVVIMLIGLAPGTIKGLFTNGASNFFMKAIALIIVFFGLLTFGKEAPKLLFDLLGIKSTGMISAAAKRALAIAGVAGTSTVTGLRNTIGYAQQSHKYNTEQYGSARNLSFKRTGVAALGMAAAIKSGVTSAGLNAWNSRNAHTLSDARKIGAQNVLNTQQNVSDRMAYKRTISSDDKFGVLKGTFGYDARNIANSAHDMATRAGRYIAPGDTLRTKESEKIGKFLSAFDFGVDKSSDTSWSEANKNVLHLMQSPEYLEAFNEMKRVDSNIKSDDDFINRLREARNDDNELAEWANHLLSAVDQKANYEKAYLNKGSSQEKMKGAAAQINAMLTNPEYAELLTYSTIDKDGNSKKIIDLDELNSIYDVKNDTLMDGKTGQDLFKWLDSTKTAVKNYNAHNERLNASAKLSEKQFQERNKDKK